MRTPERVWVVPSTEVTDGVVTAWDAFADKVRKFFAFDDRCPSAVPYVPEQRALAAERERDAQAAENDHYQKVCIEQIDEILALRAERDALRADLKALVPLARLCVTLLDEGTLFSDEMTQEQAAPARLILARVAAEEGT